MIRDYRAIAVGVVLASAPGVAATFQYIDPVDPRTSLTIDTTVPSVSVLDVEYHARFCSKSLDFVCVASDAITFAVPRNVSGSTHDWTYDGHRYTVQSRFNFAVLGAHAKKAFVIASMDGDNNFVFLYSRERGLMAVQVRSAAGSRLFLSTLPKGFGALDSPR